MDNIITVQEAIRTLKMEMLGDSEQMKWAKQIAIEALEKQIPKKQEQEYDCKNCIHDEICPIWDDYNDEPCKDGYRGFCNNYDKFKDKSQYVELPCKVGKTLYCVKYESGTHFSIKEFKNINLTNILILMGDLENNASGIILLTNDKSKAEAKLKELNKK